MNRRLSSLVAVACIAGATFPRIARTQSPWLDHGAARALSLETVLPTFDAGTGASVVVIHAGGWTSVGPNLSLEGSVPVLLGSAETPPFPGESRTTIGNPYLGLRYATGPNTPTILFGVWAPLVSENAVLTSLLAAYGDFDRFEAYMPKTWSARLMVEETKRAAEQLFVAYQVGSTVTVPTRSGGETEAYANYGLAAGGDVALMRVVVGLTGRMILTEQADNIGDRTWHQLTVAATYRGGRIRPTFYLRLPLDGDSQAINTLAIGAGLAIPLQ